jgi:hypothetical protein
LYRDDSSFRFSDIAEYVNQELLNHIGNLSFCDIVGGSMTGLGILGTFLGLMIGLKDFDPSTADAMLDTIPPLIEGIKIAFLTSIFGVIFSLLFNMYSRGVQEDAADALEGGNEGAHEVNHHEGHDLGEQDVTEATPIACTINRRRFGIVRRECL